MHSSDEKNTTTRRLDQPIEVLQDRFELYRLLGRGAQGQTFLGVDRRSGQKVAVKELLLRDVQDWKSVELFEREGATLKHLDHQGIPDYVDALHFTADDGTERFFLVQEFVEGTDLETLIKDGKTFSEGEAKKLLEELLEILVYLQDRSPAVIHRDIKPSNIMLRTDGRLALIDFGAVQSLATHQQGGSTVVGTTGYMPAEQLMGRAQPATDLYALGATVVHLLSRRHPSELPMQMMRLQFAPYVNVSDNFAAYLNRLLEPHVEQRPSSARAALQALRQLDRPAPEPVATTSSTGGSTSNTVHLALLVGAMLFITLGVGTGIYFFSPPNASNQDAQSAPPAPSETTGEELRGTLNEEDVIQRLDALDLSYCDGSGSVTYRLRITPDGRVDILSVGPVHTRGAVLGCARTELDALRFPPTPHGLEEFRYEFVVNPERNAER